MTLLCWMLGETALYRGLVGSANWAVTLGRFDIQYATQTMSRYSMGHKKGHLNAMKWVFGYLKKFPKGKIVIDPDYCDILLTRPMILTTGRSSILMLPKFYQTICPHLLASQLK